ncbi:hypothetical protein [Streptosporangium sandarakinum]|uniref:hypothetical protein n=1 Tax=Streptosporangium sandarakinum TaxID=1260955 RepID=UPI003434E190
MKPTRTALIVPIPEAEEAVGPFRAALDVSAGWGVPAHVTVLYPFLPPERIDSRVLAALTGTIAAVVENVLLISGSQEPGSWRTVATFPLGRRPAG